MNLTEHHDLGTTTIAPEIQSIRSSTTATQYTIHQALVLVDNQRNDILYNSSSIIGYEYSGTRSFNANAFKIDAYLDLIKTLPEYTQGTNVVLLHPAWVYVSPENNIAHYSWSDTPLAFYTPSEQIAALQLQGNFTFSNHVTLPESM